MTDANASNIGPKTDIQRALMMDEAPVRISRRKRAWQQLKRSRLAIPGGLIVLIFIVVAILALTLGIVIFGIRLSRR